MTWGFRVDLPLRGDRLNDWGVPYVEELPDDEEGAEKDTSSSVLNGQPPRVLDPAAKTSTEAVEELSEKAQGTLLGEMGNWVLRILAGAVGGVVYGGLYVIGGLLSLALIALIRLTQIPGFLVGSILGCFCCGLCIEVGEFGAMVTSAPAKLIAGVTEVAKGLLCVSLGYIGASCLTFAELGKMDGEVAIDLRDERLLALIKANCPIIDQALKIRVGRYPLP